MTTASDDIFAPLSLYSLDKGLGNLNEDLAEFFEEFYWENLQDFYERKQKDLEEYKERFKNRCWQILEWCYENEQNIGNVVYLTFCLINVIFLVLLRIDLMSLSSLPVIKASTWNFSEGIPALLASPHNFMAANSVPEKVIFAINALGIGALFASIPVAILLATGVIAAPIAVPILLTLLPPATDMVSCSYQLYQAIKNDEPITEKAITLGYSSLMTIGLNLLCAATVTMLLCPALAPVALGLTIAGFSCLAGSALLRIGYFMQKPASPQTSN